MEETLEELLKRTGGLQNPEPEPQPEPTPEPTPAPEPEPTPVPEPEPTPEPTPTPEPEPAPEPSAKKSFLDLLNEVKPEPTPAPAPEPVIPEDIQAKIKKLEEIESNPFVKALIEIGASESDLKKIAAEIAGQDYSQMSYAELLALEVANETGLQGEDLEAEVSNLLAEHETKSAYNRVKEEKALKAKFESIKPESPTLKALQEAYAAKPKPIAPQDIAKLQEQTAIQEKSVIANLGKNLVGSDLDGVEFTEAELNEIIEKEYSVDNAAPYLDKDGNLEAGRFLYDKFRLRNFEKLVEARAKKMLEQELKKNTVTQRSANGSPVAATAKKEIVTIAEQLGIPPEIAKNFK